MIPKCCPSCKETYFWNEVINPFTTGIPIGKHFRLKLLMTRGFGFYKVKYRCKSCGYEARFDYRDDR